jgi:hypothetical protein
MDSLERRRNEASDVFEKLAAARRELFGTDAPQTNPAQQASAVQQGVALPGKDKLKWMERDCNVVSQARVSPSAFSYKQDFLANGSSAS